VAFSYGTYGEPFPSYVGGAGHLFHWRNIPEGLAGVLVSPARGLFIFSPMLLIAGYLLVRYWQTIPLRTLAKAALWSSALYVLLISSFSLWWAGICFGPRYMAPLLPWFLLVTAQGLAGSSERVCPHGRHHPRLGLCFQIPAGFLVIVSFLMHGYGIFSVHPHLWNSMPRDLNQWTARAWEWRYPPFMAGILDVPPPIDYRFLPLGVPLVLTRPDCQPFLWEGWGNPSPPGCWMIDNRARVFFALRHAGRLTLELTLRPYLRPPEVPNQRLTVSLNGVRVGDLTLSTPERSTIRFSLPAESVKATNDLFLEAPDARPVRDIQRSSDLRRLSFLVSEIRIEQAES